MCLNITSQFKGQFLIDFYICLENQTIVYLENAWNSKQMITEGEAAIPLETTRRAFGNQSQSKQRSTLVKYDNRVLKMIEFNFQFSCFGRAQLSFISRVMR